MVHGLVSLPAAETKVRPAAAWAGTAGSVTASASAAAIKIERVIGMPPLGLPYERSPRRQA